MVHPPVLTCHRMPGFRPFWSPRGASAGLREGELAITLGLIGFGTIGRAIAQAVQQGTAGDARIVAVLIREPTRYAGESALYPWKFTADPAAFFAEPMDLVVEAAGHEAVRRYAARSLQAGKDFLTISVGAFANDLLLSQVREAAIASRRRVLIPSGAIGGLDAISAAAVGGLEEVTVTTRKPPQAWKGTVAEQQVDLAKLAAPTCLYVGSAREAVRLFPQNVNVQAALGLAGIGLDRTISRVFADPTVRHNTHEIVARGHFGEIRITITNIPSEGSAKTGRITAMSMVKAIRNLSAPFVVGL